MQEPILTYLRSRRRIITGNVISMLFMFPFLYFIAWMFSFRGMPLWGCIGLLIFNLIFFGHTTYVVWSQPGDFRCTLFSDRINCECPDATMGSTFDLALSDLKEIRQRPGMESSNEFLLIDNNGGEHWLTSNFGNPAWRFVEAIKTQRPEVVVISS